jgi:preprotein translocase subunit SecY
MPKLFKALKSSTTAAGDLISILNVLSGGTLSSFSIMAMGVYPYITASIILQLLGPIIPAIERKMKDDPRAGQKWMEKWTMILTIPDGDFIGLSAKSVFFNQIVPGTTVLRITAGSGSNFLPTLANLTQWLRER